MLAFVLALAAADPIPLTTRIADVTVYSSRALVRRTATIEHGGRYVVRGLPGSLDPGDLRVRCSGGDVVHVDVRERQDSTVPNDRVQALRDRLEEARAELRRLQDERDVQDAFARGLQAFAELDLRAHSAEVVASVGGTATWRDRLAFLAKRGAELADAGRRNAWKIEDQTAVIAAIERDVTATQDGSLVTLRDVEIDVLATKAATLDLEYVLGGASWTPDYQLHAAKDLLRGDLTYRALVTQTTGEDWNDVQLVLSTAQPQRGAQGPDPVTTWIDLELPERASSSEGRLARRREAPNAPAEKARGDDAGRNVAFASVEHLGLSARFQIPRRETIPSRASPTNVLVGVTNLALAPERRCVPALDPTVWVRGKSKNTSEWLLLAGRVAVFLGTDFLGFAAIETVQPGQELTLPLGADPAVTVTRTQTEDERQGPAFLSSRASKVTSWRIHLENHGAAAANKDGSVDVIVREVLPKSKDTRLEIEFTKTEPPWSKDEGWKRDREELGIHTWLARVPRDGSTDIVLQTTLRFPADTTLVRE